MTTSQSSSGVPDDFNPAVSKTGFELLREALAGKITMNEALERVTGIGAQKTAPSTPPSPKPAPEFVMPKIVVHPPKKKAKRLFKDRETIDHQRRTEIAHGEWDL